jgi:hypothetical protein
VPPEPATCIISIITARAFPITLKVIDGDGNEHILEGYRRHAGSRHEYFINYKKALEEFTKKPVRAAYICYLRKNIIVNIKE